MKLAIRKLKVHMWLAFVACIICLLGWHKHLWESCWGVHGLVCAATPGVERGAEEQGALDLFLHPFLAPQTLGLSPCPLQTCRDVVPECSEL